MESISFRHLSLEGELIWDESHHLAELILEEPRRLRQFLADLATNEPGESFCFSEQGKALEVGKQIEVIFNPTHLDFNNRKAMTTLIKLLVKTSVSEDFYLETGKMKTRVLKYLDEIVEAENFIFDVETGDFSVDGLAKAVNIRIASDDDDYVEMLTDYLAMMAELVGTKLFVVVNLRSMLEIEELERLRHNLDNHQIGLLLVESHDYGKLAEVARIIVDRDGCEI